MMLRRTALAWMVGAACLLASGAAWSGSYLNRAALLLNGSRAERDMVMPRSSDKELVEMVHRVAKARLKAAQNMQVPKVVVGAHPHLLLVLESTERAYAAALANDQQKFLTFMMRARAEDKAFRTIIKKLGYTMPR